MDAPAPPFFVPFPRPDLIGRDADVERLHAILQRGQTAAVTPALTGQGGIGKTQLAVRYAWDKAGAYSGGVFWLDVASNAEPIPTQIGTFALRMGFAQAQDTSDTAAFYRQLAEAWIGRVGGHAQALLIADNLEQPDLLTRTLPGLPNARLTALGCKKLITTRRRDLPGCTDIIVDFLGPEDAKALLMREAKRQADGAGADEIAALLGGLPLALRVAGALMKQNPGARLERVAAALRERGAVRVLDAAKQPLDDYRNGIRISVSALLAESWNELPTQRSELKDILKALACFPESQLIRSDLLRSLVDCPEGPLGFEDTFGSDLVELYNRNLLERPDDAHLRLHPLVREYAAAQAADGFAESLIIRAAKRLRSPEFLAAQNSEALLTLLRELPMVEGMLDERS